MNIDLILIDPPHQSLNIPITHQSLMKLRKPLYSNRK